MLRHGPGPAQLLFGVLPAALPPLSALGEGGLGRVPVLFGGPSFERAHGDTGEFDGVASPCKAGR